MSDHPYPRERTWSDCEAEIERLRKDVVHWREARRSCIEAGDMMKEEIERLRSDRRAAADQIEQLRNVYKNDLAETLAEKITLAAENERLREELLIRNSKVRSQAEEIERLSNFLRTIVNLPDQIRDALARPLR